MKKKKKEDFYENCCYKSIILLGDFDLAITGDFQVATGDEIKQNRGKTQNSSKRK